MSFIRKVRVLFKTRLIFSRINGPIITFYRSGLKSSRVKDVVSLQDSYNGDKACLIVVSFSLLAGQFAEADIAKSLLHMISNDIGQVR